MWLDELNVLVRCPSTLKFGRSSFQQWPRLAPTRPDLRFPKTGVYVCEENERCLSKRKVTAWSGAIDEYHNALAGPRQVTVSVSICAPQ
jgi:hypothetical protein